MLQSPLNKLVFIIALALVLPLLFMQGMFMDGLMYAAVSKNLAQGIGTFWQPFYGDDYFGLPGFYENPPLGIFNLALFFKVFGTDFWVERFFILCQYLLTIYGIWLNLKIVIPKAAKNVFWFSLLSWALIPTVFWTFRQNMMEVQMLPLLLFSNWFMLRSLKEGKSFAFNLIFFSALTLGSFLVKGVVGAFLIGAPFAYFLAVDRSWRSIYFGLANILVLVLTGFLLYQKQTVQDFFYYYLEVRTAARIKHIPTVGSRFWILGEFAQQMILPLILMAIVYFSRIKDNTAAELKSTRNWVIFFLLLGIGGSFPLMITKVQRPFYLMTSFPFYILAASLLIEPKIRSVGIKVNAWKRSQLVINSLAGLLLITVLALTINNWGAYRRDEQLQKDLATLMTDLGEPEKIYVEGELLQHWSLKAYAVRNEDLDLLHFPNFKAEKSPYVISKKLPETETKFKEYKSYQSFKLYRLE